MSRLTLEREGRSVVGGEGEDPSMEAVARLAGKVAHHLNNMLTVVGGCTSYIESELEDERFGAEFEDIRQVCQRAKAFAAQLLAISGSRWIEPDVLDLRTLVQMLDLPGIFGPEVAFGMDFVSTTCPVHVDRGAMTEVLRGLALNARDAVGSGGAVMITIDHLPGGIRQGRRSPGWIRLEFSDSGSGMKEEALKRAFHPFYTTHPWADERGLGLSTAYGIVRQCGGRMMLSSAPGQGTLVRLWLPAVPPASPTRPAAPSLGDEPLGQGDRGHRGG